MENTFDLLQTCIKRKEFFSIEQLLTDWSSVILEKEDYSFETGLLGFGWLVNYLIHEKYLEGNADEILEDIDDNVYKLAIKEVLSRETNVNALLGYVTYYQQRLMYDSDVDFYRKFSHFECFKLLIEKLNTFLLTKPLLSDNIVSQKVDVLLKYSFLMRVPINEELFEGSFYFAVEELLNFLEKSSSIECIKLGVCIYQYKHPHWEARIDNIISSRNSSSVWSSFLRDFSDEKILLARIIEESEISIDNRLLFQLLTNVKGLHYAEW